MRRQKSVRLDGAAHSAKRVERTFVSADRLRTGPEPAEKAEFDVGVFDERRVFAASRQLNGAVGTARVRRTNRGRFKNQRESTVASLLRDKGRRRDVFRAPNLPHNGANQLFVADFAQKNVQLDDAPGEIRLGQRRVEPSKRVERLRASVPFAVRGRDAVKILDAVFVDRRIGATVDGAASKRFVFFSFLKHRKTPVAVKVSLPRSKKSVNRPVRRKSRRSDVQAPTKTKNASVSPPFALARTFSTSAPPRQNGKTPKTRAVFSTTKQQFLL